MSVVFVFTMYSYEGLAFLLVIFGADALYGTNCISQRVLFFLWARKLPFHLEAPTAFLALGGPGLKYAICTFGVPIHFLFNSVSKKRVSSLASPSSSSIHFLYKSHPKLTKFFSGGTSSSSVHSFLESFSKTNANPLRRSLPPSMLIVDSIPTSNILNTRFWTLCTFSTHS